MSGLAGGRPHHDLRAGAAPPAPNFCLISCRAVVDSCPGMEKVFEVAPDRVAAPTPAATSTSSQTSTTASRCRCGEETESGQQASHGDQASTWAIG